MYFSTPCSFLRTELIDRSVVNCLFHLIPRPLEPFSLCYSNSVMAEQAPHRTHPAFDFLEDKLFRLIISDTFS